jgi:hypothetical protein
MFLKCNVDIWEQIKRNLKDFFVIILNSNFLKLKPNKKLPSYFNFKNIQKPSNLYAKVIEVDCRIVPAMSNCQMGKKKFLSISRP